MKTTTIQKWGNSYAVRIPHLSVQKLNLKAGRHVRIIEGAGGSELRIVPLSEKSATLRELVLQITKKNRHTAVAWGIPVGKEVW